MGCGRFNSSTFAQPEFRLYGMGISGGGLIPTNPWCQCPRRSPFTHAGSSTTRQALVVCELERSITGD